MGSVGCFYIVYSSEKDEAADQDLVLEVTQKDKYAPKNTGVYDVRLQTTKAKLTKEVDEKTGNHKLAQQWRYDAKKKALFSLLYPEKALFEGANKNLIVYNFKGLKNQKFTFYPSKHLVVNSVTMRAIELNNNQQATAGAEVVTAKIRPGNGLRQKFKAQTCASLKASVKDVAAAKDEVSATHKDSAKKVAGIESNDDDDKSEERAEAEQERKDKVREKKKAIAEAIKKANDLEDLDAKAPLVAAIVDDKKDESDEAKAVVASAQKTSDALMAAADQAAMGVHQLEKKSSKRSTESTLATAKTMIDSLMKSLDTAEVSSSAQKEAIKHEKEEASEDDDESSSSNDSMDSKKAALEAKLAKL